MKKIYFPHFSKMNLKVMKKHIKSPTLVKHFAFQKEFKKILKEFSRKLLDNQGPFQE